MTMGEQIRQIRKSQKITALRLSELVNVAHETIHRIETNKTGLRWSTLQKIATVLNVDFNAFIASFDVKKEKETAPINEYHQYYS